MRIELHIPIPTPSSNELNRRHWSYNVKVQATWDRWVGIAMLDSRFGMGLPTDFKWASEAQVKRKVTITRYSSGTLDADNFIGGLKAVIDALRLRHSKNAVAWELGGKPVYDYKGNDIIVDDNDKWLVHGEHRQEKAPRGKGRTVIVIEEVSDGAG